MTGDLLEISSEVKSNNGEFIAFSRAMVLFGFFENSLQYRVLEFTAGLNNCDIFQYLM